MSRRVKSFPITPRVTLRPDERGQRWLLGVSSADRSGLLYAIARVLARHHINLQLAKISTLGERVEGRDRRVHPVIPGEPVHLRRHGAASGKERDVYRIPVQGDRAPQDMELIRNAGEAMEEQDRHPARSRDPDVLALPGHAPMVGP